MLQVLHVCVFYVDVRSDSARSQMDQPDFNNAAFSQSNGNNSISNNPMPSFKSRLGQVNITRLKHFWQPRSQSGGDASRLDSQSYESRSVLSRQRNWYIHTEPGGVGTIYHIVHPYLGDVDKEDIKSAANDDVALVARISFGIAREPGLPFRSSSNNVQNQGIVNNCTFLLTCALG